MSKTNSSGTRKIDITGRKFFRLTAIRELPKAAYTLRKWLCQCDCGRMVEVVKGNLTSGNTTSCGCRKIDRIVETKTKHGHGGGKGKKESVEYSTWKSIIARCHNPNYKDWYLYGGRGIKVCDRWRESFAAFLEDMGSRPEGKYSIDRIDNSGPYEPGNCRWATDTQQAQNSRKNVLLTYRGQTECVSEWSRVVGIVARTLHQRVAAGWSVEDILTRPVRRVR